MTARWAMLAEESGLLNQVGVYVVPLFGSVMLAYALFNLVADLRRAESKKVARRLRESDSADTASAREAAIKASILRRRDLAETSFSRALSSLSFVPSLERMLERAALEWSAPKVLLHLLGAASGMYIAAHFLGQSAWVCAGLAAVAIIGPLVTIYVKMRMRLSKFMNQLPDVFELMSQALRAGHSLPNAILVVSQQLPDPVATEFARVFHEQNLGIKIEDSLRDMATRVGLMDVKFFVTAVLIQRQTGGDLAEVLDNISGVIRDRIKLFGSVKALTAEGRLSGYVLLALPVVVFLVELIINPNYADVMIQEEMGQYALIAAGISQILGLAMIQKIVNIKV